MIYWDQFGGGKKLCMADRNNLDKKKDSVHFKQFGPTVR